MDHLRLETPIFRMDYHRQGDPGLTSLLLQSSVHPLPAAIPSLSAA